MTERATPVVFAIDVEPDDPEFPPGSKLPWLGFERCVDFFDEVRDDLARATGSPVQLTWSLRMDGQIERGYGSITWVVEKYSAKLDHLRKCGDQIGLHTHAWRWEEGKSRWIADWGDEAWVEDVTRTSFEAYRRAFGTDCGSHRAGDRFMSNGLLAVLRSLGVEVDLTAEPGMRGVPVGPSEPHTTDIPDMALVPRLPYFPSHDDWRRPNADAQSDDLLMLPLASADPGPTLGPLRAAARRMRSGGRVLHRPVLPWSPRMGPRLWDLLGPDIRSGSLTTLAFAMRSHTALEDESRNALLASFAALESQEFAGSLAFVTASDARRRSVSAPVSSAGR